MILSKKYFSDSQLQLSEVCKALASPVRIAILEQIVVKDSCIERELVEVMGLAPTTVLSHLQALKKAGIIKGSVTSGNRLCYCIDWQTLNDFKSNFDTLHEKITQHHEKVRENKGKCMVGNGV